MPPKTKTTLAPPVMDGGMNVSSGFDILQLMQMAGDQRMQQLQQMQAAPMLKPRMGISQSPRNRTPYNVMDDPNYKPFGGQQYGAIGQDGKVTGSWRDLPGGPQNKPSAAAPAPQAAPQSQGRGFMDILGGLFGGPKQVQPQAQQGPRINSLTGLPFGTLPGDPAYQDKLVQGAPKAVPVQEPQVQPSRSTGIDPSLTALKDLVNMATPQQRSNAQKPQPAQPAPPTYPKSNAPLVDVISPEESVAMKMLGRNVADRQQFNQGLNNVQLDFKTGTNAPMADIYGQQSTSPFQSDPRMAQMGEISGRAGNAAPGWPQPDFSPYTTPSPMPIGPRPALGQVAQFDPYVATQEMERQFDTGAGMYYPSLTDIMLGIDQKFQQFPTNVTAPQTPSPQPLPPRMAFQQVARFDPYVAMQERVRQFEEQQRMLAPYASL